MFITRWFRKQNRKFDLKTLWPQCKKAAQEYPVSEDKKMDLAKVFFVFHVFNDRAWTKDYTEEELIQFIDGLH